LAPQIFDSVEIGKTAAEDAEMVVGRKVKISLIELIGNFKKYYLKLSFRVTEVKGEQALTEFVGSEVLADYISRMIHRRNRRLDTVQDLKTKDGKSIRVKTIAVLGRRVKSSVQKSVRLKVLDVVKAEVEGSTTDEFVGKMVNDDIRTKVLTEGRRVYPIRNFEIRKTEVG
jgi:small subunit ribosomal protein S3Ae